MGLIYPSDYGYATGGGSREVCLATDLTNWDGSSDCYNNDWIYNDSYQWTFTSSPSISSYVVNVTL